MQLISLIISSSVAFNRVIISDTSDTDDFADTNGNESQTNLTPGRFSREGLNVFCLNINFFPKHLDDLRIFIEQNKPHVVCLNETKIDGTIGNEVPEMMFISY